MSYDLRFLSTHVSTKYQCFLLKHFQLSLFQVTLCTLCSELDPKLHSEAKVCQRNNSWCYYKRSSLFCLRLLSLLFPSTDANKRIRSIIDSFTGSSRVSKSFEQTSSPSKRYMGEGTIGLYLLLRRRWSKLLSRTESLWSDCKLSTLSRYSAGSSAGI